MVIFHSYVSLPEGNQVGMTNRDFWSSWTCQILSGPSPGVQNPRRALGIRQGRRVVHQLQELERPGTLGWSEYSGDQRSTSKKGRWIFYMGFMNVLWCYLIIWMCSLVRDLQPMVRLRFGSGFALGRWMCMDLQGYRAQLSSFHVIFLGGPNHQVPNKKTIGKLIARLFRWWFTIRSDLLGGGPHKPLEIWPPKNMPSLNSANYGSWSSCYFCRGFQAVVPPKSDPWPMGLEIAHRLFNTEATFIQA